MKEAKIRWEVRKGGLKYAELSQTSSHSSSTFVKDSSASAILRVTNIVLKLFQWKLGNTGRLGQSLLHLHIFPERGELLG